MILKSWDELPAELRRDEVKPYYDSLSKKKLSLLFKRIFDLLVSIILLILLSPIFLILAISIKLDSKGPVFFKQDRVTRYNKDFKIYKFRTMVVNADKKGPQITEDNDSRITRVGSTIRKFRLDEISQLLNVITGDMTFVGTRPEVRKYVDEYTDEMLATLLLPAGITSKSSIKFKDESKIIAEHEGDVDTIYLNYVLPQKMEINLKELEEFSFFSDIKIMLLTVYSVFI